VLDNLATPRKALSLRSRLQPVPDSANAALGISSVRSDILAGNVGDELPVAVLFAVKYQSSFVALVPRPESLAAGEKAEFQRHVEARQPGDSIQRYRGEIVDAVPALFDDPLNFREADFAGVVIFQSGAGDEAEVIDGKDNRIEYRLKPVSNGQLMKT